MHPAKPHDYWSRPTPGHRVLAPPRVRGVNIYIDPPPQTFCNMGRSSKFFLENMDVRRKRRQFNN